MADGPRLVLRQTCFKFGRVVLLLTGQKLPPATVIQIKSSLPAANTIAAGSLISNIKSVILNTNARNVDHTIVCLDSS